MSAAVRRPRLVTSTEPSTPHPAERSSAAIKADMAALANEKVETDAEVARITVARRKALVAGDDEVVEEQDRLLARAKRRLERADLREPGMAEDLAAAEKREQEAAREELRARAEKARDAVIADLALYDQAAETIAAFLRRWREATGLCRAAEIWTPNFVARGQEDREIPEKRERVTAYLTEDGQITQDMHVRRPDGIIEPHRYRQAVEREVVTQEARTDQGARLPELADLVVLPCSTEPGYVVEGQSRLRNSY